MKRSAFLTLCMCLLMLSFSGCYRYPMPDPNPDNIWVSDDPEISFVCFDAGEPCEGKMNIDGNIIEIEIYFDYSNQMFIHPTDEELRNDGSDGRLLLGHIEMSEDQIIYMVIPFAQPGEVRQPRCAAGRVVPPYTIGQIKAEASR